MAATPQIVEITIDGKTAEITKPTARHDELNAALRDPASFQRFKIDPAAFTVEYGLSIDPELAAALRQQLVEARDLDHAHQLAAIGSGGGSATVWAVAGGAYSVATSKIAVAF